MLSRAPSQPTPPPPSTRGCSIHRIVSHRGVQTAAVVWAGGHVLALVLAPRGLPFDLPDATGESIGVQLLSRDILLAEVLLVLGVVWALTRRRWTPQVAARAPHRTLALRETLLVLAYAAAGQVAGVLLGHALGWHAFSFHLVGTLHGTNQHVAPAEAVTWAAHNLVVYAVIPYLMFRRRYSREQLGLRANDLRSDTKVIAVVLTIEIVFQLWGGNGGIANLTGRQLLVGAPLTFALFFLGTVLPTMVLIYCILIPRYLALTGSVTTTVLLGGLTYTAVHAADGWAQFTSPRAVALTIVFLLGQYFGPGMIKTYLTVRTGNAWVHVWAYHALAPHVLLDTPLVVHVFDLR